MANYPIPPWLNVSPSDFGAAAAKGAEISLGRARIAEEARQANMRASTAAAEMSARREQEQQNSQRESQQLEYQKAYQQAQIGLKQQEIDQDEQQLQMQVKSAAMKSQAQQEIQARIRAGEDPSKVMMDLGPQIGLTADSMATLARKPPNLGEVTPIDIGGKTYHGVRTGANSMRLVAPPPQISTNPVQSVPVMSPSGEELPGVVGIPGPGRTFIRNVPKETGADALQKMVDQRKAALGKTSTGTSGGKSVEQQKVDRAHALAKEHPDWTKEQVISEVKKEFKGR